MPVLAIALHILEYRAIISRMTPLKRDMLFFYSKFCAYALVKQTIPNYTIPIYHTNVPNIPYQYTNIYTITVPFGIVCLTSV